MPSTVHATLAHAWQFIAATPLPPGMFSEEAGESANKELRKARLHHSRKCSTTTTDVMRNRLVATDPVIALAILKKTKKDHNKSSRRNDGTHQGTFAISSNFWSKGGNWRKWKYF
eukprot:Pompholyxophrys_punicea_v1_NODE_1264_length_830_cov_1.491613.p1 type:complete len:115 gc:universal NODE_1264_length_830_cov_1.491613:548-204(-)